MRNSWLIAAGLLLASCKVGPDYEAPKTELPEQWKSAEQTAPAQPLVSLDWWKLFKDEQLNKLEAEGLANNADIARAAARVAEARATLRLTDADLYPELSGQADATRTSRSKEALVSGVAPSDKPYNSFGLSLVLDYEIDLWGKLRRASEASRAELLTEKANRDAVQLAVASDIATGYFNLLALDRQREIAQQTIRSRKTSLGYQQKQYNAGVIDAFTLRRTEAELAAAQATLPQLEQSYTEQEHALSILLGRSPKEIIESSPKGSTKIADLPVPPSMPVDAPSTLLERRPDVYAAEQQLIAANARIGVAKADYFPTITLSALLGLASSDLDRLLRSSARTWNAGASSAVPLLNAGRTSANVDIAKARNDEALAAYQQTVRSAFADVANALTRIQTSAERTTSLEKQARAYGEASRIAKARFDAGYTPQLDLLDAERQLLQAQLDEVNARGQQLAATVTLYKALGGGWEPASRPSKP